MRDSCFVETNILIYSLIGTDLEKRRRAREIFHKPRVILSTQVLLETSNVLLRKAKIHPSEISITLGKFLVHEIVIQTPAVIEMAWKICERYGFGIYDSMIVASALVAKAAILYSDDLQHDQKIDSLRIVNPFLG